LYRITGKDIFKLNKVFFPINQGGLHWACAVAFMQEKKVQYYDSMGGNGMYFLENIFHYIQDEHMDKKGLPLMELDCWNLIPCTSDTPRQMNGTLLIVMSSPLLWALVSASLILSL
jgi:Ulp1 family protease